MTSPSQGQKELVLRARVVLPISRAPIKDGVVRVSGGRIRGVGSWRDLADKETATMVDLGDAVLLPGLVNAHCHLDYTSMAGQFPPPRLFTDWIKLLTITKAQLSYSEFAESWLSGARMLLRTGTTTVGDIESVPELLPEVWSATPLRMLSFLEMIGIKPTRKPQKILKETLDRIAHLPAGERKQVGLSPHAPYSTTPELLSLSAATARKCKWPLAIHVSESAQEFDMFTRGKGEMYDWLRKNERDMSDCGLCSPVKHLEKCAALRNHLLAIHVNYLAKKDVELLARRKVSVAHCPRSHAYFKHDPFPVRRLTKARINICLGTDSLASVYQRRGQKVELSMFEEMRAFLTANPKEPPEQILRMATICGGRVLGLRGQVGEISSKAFADMIVLPFKGKMADIYEAVLHHEGGVAGSMINGEWAIEPSLA